MNKKRSMYFQPYNSKKFAYYIYKTYEEYESDKKVIRDSIYFHTGMLRFYYE